MFSGLGQVVHLETPSEQFNLDVPYTRPLNGFMRPYKVRIVGVINEQARRFQVNFAGANGETLLHFNPRFDENCVVRNSTRNQQWQLEERHGGQPFERLLPFTLDFVAEEGQIRVSVNGEWFCDFLTRDTFSQVTSLAIEGDVKLHYVGVSN